MKKVKIIIIIFLITILVGCKAEYNINIDNNNINEEILIYENSKIVNNLTDQESNELGDIILDWERGYDYYNRELYSKDNNTGYKYTASFKYDEYDYLSQISKCYDEFKVTNKNTFKIETSKNFLCADYYEGVKELKINISSSYNIVSSNADIKDNNKHTWIINKNNYTNKPIKFEISRVKQTKETTKYHKKFNYKLVLTTILFLVLLLIYKKTKRTK